MFIDVGLQTQVNTTAALEELNYGIVKGLAGSLFAVYISVPVVGGPVGPTAIILRALSATGAPTGAEISFAIPAPLIVGGVVDSFGVIGLNDGTFGMVYEDTGGGTTAIRYQQFSATGIALGAIVTLASAATLSLNGLSADASGGFHISTFGPGVNTVTEFTNLGVLTTTSTPANFVDEIEVTSTGATVLSGSHSNGPTNVGIPRYYVDFPGANPAIEHYYPSLSIVAFTEVRENVLVLQSDTIAFAALELDAYNYSAGNPAPGIARAIQIVRFTDGQPAPSVIATLFRPVGNSETPSALEDFIRLADGSFALAIATQFSPSAYPTLELIHISSGGGVIGTYEMLNPAGSGGGGVELAQLANGNVIATYSGITAGTGTDLEVFVETFSTTAESLVPTAGIDSLTGTAAAETIDGLAGDDTINAAAGDDILLGNDGDDFLRGQAGFDTLNGGNGSDWAAYDRDSSSGGNAGVTVNLGTGTATDGFGNTDTLISIERVRGTAQVDTLTGSNITTETEMFQGLAGADIINGAGGFDEVRYDRDFNAGGRSGVSVNLVVGTATDGFGATDTLSNIEAVRGSNLADTLIGNALNNEFRGLGGADSFNGAGGSDTLRYDSDADNGGVFGITATYTTSLNGTVVDGFGSTDTFLGFNTIRGTLLVDTFNGNSGSQFFIGLGGNDIFNGGTGNDRARYDRDFLYVGGGAGVVVNLSAASVNIGGAVAAGTARDGFGNTDTLNSIEEASGTSQSDTFVGGTGYSFFQGLAGADTYTSSVVQYRDGYTGNYANVDYQGDGGASGVTVNLQTGVGVDGFGAAESYTNISGIFGTSQVDTFIGNQYHNYFVGYQGADTINGGGGYDRVDYSRDQGSGGTGGITVDLAAGTATDGFGAIDSLSNIEQITGTSFIDNISGNNWDNFISSGSGSDILVGREGIDNLRPGLGTDTVDGSPGGNADQSSDDRDEVNYSDLTPDGSGLGVIVNLSTASITHEAFTVTASTARDTGGSTDTLIDIERARGTSGRDYFRGSDTANLREEIFRGLGGNDLIDGGAGFNVVRYSGDTADFSSTTGAGGTLGAIVNLSAASITVGAVTVLAGTARDSFGNTDTLVNINGVRGTGLADHVVGGAGHDFFRSFGGADYFDGGAGTNDEMSFFYDDVFNGNTGQGVIVNMETGTAVTFVDSAVMTFTNVENISGSERNDIILGNGSNNDLFGELGDDNLIGGDGNDTLNGQQGADILNGGNGRDIVIYRYDPTFANYQVLQRAEFGTTPWAGVTVNLQTGIATDANGGTDTLSNIEGIEGTFFADTLTGDNGDNFFFGLSGNDIINGLGGIDRLDYSDRGQVNSTSGVPVLVGINASRPNGVVVNMEVGFATDGEGGVDTFSNIENVTGSTGGDVVLGNGGDNYIIGGLGNDNLIGGGGADNLDGGAGGDQFTGGTGWDYVRYDTATAGVDARMYGAALNTGEAAGDTYNGIEGLFGSSHSDTLYGDGSLNVLLGQGGDDFLDGVGGGDYYFGGEGNDSMVSRLGGEVFDGGSGFDYARYDYSDTGVAAYLYDSSQNTGWAAGDSYTAVECLVGSIFSDDLRGDAALNVIYGLSGDDFIIGLGGQDYLNGGSGYDLFHYVTANDGGPSGDLIQDFVSGTDRITVTGSLFTLAYLSGGVIESWRFAEGTSAIYATSQFIYDSASQQLWYDQDGTGAGAKILMATLQAGATMASTDILVL